MFKHILFVVIMLSILSAYFDALCETKYHERLHHRTNCGCEQEQGSSASQNNNLFAVPSCYISIPYLLPFQVFYPSSTFHLILQSNAMFRPLKPTVIIMAKPSFSYKKIFSPVRKLLKCFAKFSLALLYLILKPHLNSNLDLQL